MEQQQHLKRITATTNKNKSSKMLKKNKNNIKMATEKIKWNSNNKIWDGNKYTSNFEVQMGKKKQQTNAFANYANIPIIEVQKALKVNSQFSVYISHELFQ